MAVVSSSVVTSQTKTELSESTRSKIIIFIAITSVCLLVSFRVSSKLMKSATILATRIRHEQSRQQLLMTKLVANYSARLDAERWKGTSHGGDSAARIQELEIEVEHLKRDNLNKERQLIELTNLYGAVRSHKG
mmetsp:Transcript_2667/g.3679  ORF Transcript_2667/g.3679 Transcript_2667/m.3679 type:complete len:134 (+) Transcript_2667:34-435(+)|eukprot:CAMPEP_0185253132 /NCGR_PEP_ID=MMETSP1359-20130426/2014_1 /TAXON_ID=552665 /ORGANISM="Bigelowiella longifila, Strain CCMP242" /LENGTH=133 /DNA_ID=CAMNT_0027835465 /DNA_START=32 /DNA_END=433 /DNA_ORIENTATION=+